MQVQDEYTFITDLSYNLSSRYQRPESSILVTVTHSACLLFGASFDPAYIMTITALPTQLQPVTNKRNAALLQKGMHESLGVIPARGIIKFVAIAEENIAIDGRTVAAEIEDVEKETAEDNMSVKRSMSRKSQKSPNARSLRNLRMGSPLPTHKEQMAPARTEIDAQIMPAPDVPRDRDGKTEKALKMGRRRSFMAAVFGKS